MERAVIVRRMNDGYPGFSLTKDACTGAFPRGMPIGEEPALSIRNVHHADSARQQGNAESQIGEQHQAKSHREEERRVHDLLRT